jgi:hypothetical protein
MLADEGNVLSARRLPAGHFAACGRIFRKSPQESEMVYNPYLLAGVLIGNVLRTVIPYLMSGEKWQWKYITSAVWGALLAFAGGTLALPAIDPGAPPLTAFLLGLFAAIAIQTGARQTEKVVERIQDNPQP